MNQIKSHNNISINKGYNKFILKYDWDFFITLTYESNRKPETIRNHIENIYNNIIISLTKKIYGQIIPCSN